MYRRICRFDLQAFENPQLYFNKSTNGNGIHVTQL